MKNHSADRFASERQDLADLIAQAVPGEGTFDVQPEVNLARFDAPTELHHGFLDPCFCVIAQGAKTLTLGGEEHRYDPAHYMIATVGVPMTAQVVEASAAIPYLSLRLNLDPAVVASVMVEAGIAPAGKDTGVRAINVSPLDADLLGATVRLARLLDKPDDYRVLGSLVTREIVYRLLTGAQGSRMRHLAKTGGQSHRMVRAIKVLRENFDKPLRIEYVARDLSMSVSGFHAHFKAVTAMSPLQFQKQIRLQEARRLMLSENLDAGEAAGRVGYDDRSYFSRDYKKHFGEPPMRDVARLRELAIE